MALIKCPDCEKEFSDLATACPNCARPQFTYPASASPSRPAKRKGLGCVSGSLVVLLALFIGAAIINTQRDPGEKAAAGKAASDAYESGVATSEAEDKVKAQLKDPESATFQHETVVRHQNGTAVCGQVNAKNGFGGFTGYTDFIVITTAVIRSGQNDARFVKAWNKSCR
jgi:predicted  nucleic acid-binding Zn-ribbon protein